MNNVLIVVEKPYMARTFKEYLPNVKFMSLEGHAYTLDEEKLLQVSKETLDSSICVKYKNEKGIEEPVYILNSQRVNENCQEIFNYLKENNIDFIVNACDYDKNGNYLFKYAIEDVMKLNSNSNYSFKRMNVFDWSKEGFIAEYNNLFDDTEKGE